MALILFLAALTILRMAATVSTVRVLAPISFLLMAASPWLLFDREGRRKMGLTGVRSKVGYPLAVAAGALAAAVCFGLGLVLFGDSVDNWFVTVAAGYAEVPAARGYPLLVLHAIFTVPALLFSPFGEEIFFRGVLQRVFEGPFGRRLATILQAGTFAVVHLLHHGLEVSDSGLVLRPISGAIWIGLMFGAALLFAAIKAKTGSLYPAIASHAAFNLTMNATIFTFLWPV